LRLVQKLHPIGTLSELPDGTAVLREIDGRTICVLREGDTVRACSSECPHQYASLEGSFADKGHIVCRFHGLRFDMKQGGCTNASGYSLEIVPVTQDLQTGQFLAVTNHIIEE
jgi:nitrite reductase/ring-hydroxylating ferredoxin subunit